MGLLVAALAVSAIACGGSSKKTTSPTKTAAYQTPIATQARTTPKATAAKTPATSATTPTEGATVIVTQNAQLGAILTDASGRTLYKFANDQPNVSNCAIACAQLWPPLTISGGTPTAGQGVTGALGTIQRSDGTTQVTLDGTPLYRFSNDTAPGDTKGDGFAGLWSVAKPGG